MTTKKPKSKIEVEQPTLSEPVIADSIVNNAPEPALETQEKASIKKSKSPKLKVIRDSFSFPEHDYRKISELKKSCLAAGIHVKKSEILRVGLYLLSQMNLDELKQAVEKIEKVRTGRPSSASD